MISKELKETNALIDGHFLLSSGRHSGQYVQCAKLLMQPDIAEKAVAKIIKNIDSKDIDLVVGPAMGGVVISYEVARQLNKPSIFAERVNGKFTFKRGFKVEKGTKVLITEDVITTGKSIREVIDLLEELGAEIVGLFCLVDRMQHNLEEYKLYSGTKLNIETYDPDTCPYCKNGLKIDKPGSRNFNV